MIETDVVVGTACAHCKKLGHWCKAVICMDGIPWCDSCYDDIECDTVRAHRIRLTGLGGEDMGNFSGPVRVLPVDRSITMRDAEQKSDWRQEFERRSKEEAKPKVKPTPSAEILESRRLARLESQRASARRRRADGKNVHISTMLTCGCGRRMQRGNKYGVCTLCADRRYSPRDPRPQCSFPGCLETTQRNKGNVCWWHNPRNKRDVKKRAAQPKMQQEAA